MAFSMIEYNGDLFAIGGAHDESIAQNAIYKFSCHHGDCKWVTMEQQLNVARASFVAIPMSDA